MSDLRFRLGNFGTSCFSRSAISECPIPCRVIAVSDLQVIVEEEYADGKLVVHAEELLPNRPKVGDLVDCIVLTDPSGGHPGLASIRRAARVGINTVQDVSVVIEVLDNAVLVDTSSGRCQALYVPSREAPTLAVGRRVIIETTADRTTWVRK